MSEHLEDLGSLPKAVRALAEKYPACLCGDFSECRHSRTRQMMEMILELVIAHPKYMVDNGSELLWRDLATVALNAIEEGDDVVPAIESFLIAATDETPDENERTTVQ